MMTLIISGNSSLALQRFNGRMVWSSEIQALHGFLCQLNGNSGPSTPGSNMSFSIDQYQ